MAEPGGISVHRPSDKASLIESLLKTSEHGVFATYRDELVFSAALGWSQGRKEPFDNSGGLIEWSTMINRFGSEDLIDVIAYSDSQDPEILDPKRLPERLRIFEAYANGGLSIIQELMGREALTPGEAVVRLVSRQTEDPNTSDSGFTPDLRDLGKVLGL